MGLHPAATKAMQDKMLLLRLEADGAMSREKAVPHTSLPTEMDVQIKYYVAKGILKETSEGGVYIDRRAYQDHKAANATVGKWALLIIGLSSLIGLLFMLANKS